MVVPASADPSTAPFQVPTNAPTLRIVTAPSITPSPTTESATAVDLPDPKSPHSPPLKHARSALTTSPPRPAPTLPPPRASEDYNIEALCDGFDDIMQLQAQLVSGQAELQSAICKLQRGFRRQATEFGKKNA